MAKQTLSNFQNLTASLFGVAAGILGLESYAGFLFYAALTLLMTLLFYVVRVVPASSPSSSSSSSKAARGKGPLDTSMFFRSPFDFWTGGVFGGLAGYILTWTLFYGLVRA